jgi:hypothetical protein
MEDNGVVKPKKFALPRFYVRNSRAIDILSDITDELETENYKVSDIASTSNTTVPNEIHLEVAEQDTIVEQKQDFE